MQLQHTVPRFLLKNFAADKKHRVWVFDKHTGKRYHTNIKNVAAERGFYDIPLGDTQVSLEPELARIESRTAPLLQNILDARSLGTATDGPRAVLSFFLAALFVRTKEYRLRFEHLGQSVKTRLQGRGASASLTDTLTDQDQDTKLAGLRGLIGVPALAPHFLNKVWALFQTPHEFLISDNPITLDHRPYGNLGLSVRGIQIYLPLSSTLTLALLCPSVAAPFLRAADQFQLLDHVSPGEADRLLRNPQSTRTFCEGLAAGIAIPLVPENVTRLNSLQVTFSSRFVYSETGDFALVEQMIRDNPRYREGLKPTLD